jgi:threonine aldolase
MLPVETNILIFEVQDTYTPVSFTNYLKERKILCIPISSTQVRMVLHMDISETMVHDLVKIIDHM